MQLLVDMVRMKETDKMLRSRGSSANDSQIRDLKDAIRMGENNLLALKEEHRNELIERLAKLRVQLYRLTGKVTL